jgi:hypothetical protein
MSSQEFSKFMRDDCYEDSVPISRYTRKHPTRGKASPESLPVEASPINRRAFLKAVSVAGVAASVLGYSTAGDAQEPSMGKNTGIHQKQAGRSPLSSAAVGPGKWVEAEEGTEAILQALNANEVDAIFFCSGTDNLPLMEAIAKFKALKRRTPRLITCPHEHVAMAAAHGHFMVSRRPQVVFVHVDVGTQNVGGALHNAWRGQAGVVFLAGRAPWTTHGELRGSRNFYIHWLQETFDQGEIVRQYTKWDYELRTAKQAGLVVQRAFQLSASEPCGPVYLTLPREVVMKKMNGAFIYPPKRYSPTIAAQGDAEAVREAARLLVKAERPVIVVNMMGRHIKSVSALVQLAESLSIPVIDNRERMNFPTTHLLHMGSSFQRTSGFVKHADVVLAIDHDVPYVPVTGCPSDNTKIIGIDIDPIKQTFPLWGFPIDVPIIADSSKAIPVLCKMAQEFITEKDRMRYAERRKILEAEHMDGVKESQPYFFFLAFPCLSEGNRRKHHRGSRGGYKQSRSVSANRIYSTGDVLWQWRLELGMGSWGCHRCQVDFTRKSCCLCYRRWQLHV